MKTITDFMLALHKDLIKERGIAETTAQQYIRNLYSLNNERPFNNLAWLKNTDSIHVRLSEFANSTQKSMLSCIVSTLSLIKDKPTYKKIYTYWYNEMMSHVSDVPVNAKTKKQEENWLSWDNVLSHEKRLTEEVAVFQNAKELTPVQWDTLLSLVVLSLYTKFAPRRNQDYQCMDVVKKLPKDTDCNFLDLENSQFVFNKYKTAKTHGQQIFDIPPDLMHGIKLYLKFHPGKKRYPFLVNYKGEALTAVNSITRILNRIFGKNVGATMLRHIYLSDKYDIAEMKEDADKMGHTVDMQRDYMKVDIPTLN